MDSREEKEWLGTAGMHARQGKACRVAQCGKFSRAFGAWGVRVLVRILESSGTMFSGAWRISTGVDHVTREARHRVQCVVLCRVQMCVLSCMCEGGMVTSCSNQCSGPLVLARSRAQGWGRTPVLVLDAMAWTGCGGVW